MPYGLGIDLGTGRAVAAISYVRTEADGRIPETEVVLPGQADHVGEPSVSGPHHGPAELTARQVSRVVEAVTEQRGSRPDRITLAQPVGWGVDECDAFRTALLTVGLPEVTLVPAGLAAAITFTTEWEVRAGHSLAIYDSGGMFSASVAYYDGTGVTPLGPPRGLPEGGNADGVDVLEAAIAAAGLATSEIGTVVVTGAGARTPEVSELIGSATGRPVVVLAEPDLATARGAAYHAWSRIAPLITEMPTQPLPMYTAYEPLTISPGIRRSDRLLAGMAAAVTLATIAVPLAVLWGQDLRGEPSSSPAQQQDLAPGTPLREGRTVEHDSARTHQAEATAAVLTGTVEPSPGPSLLVIPLPAAGPLATTSPERLAQRPVPPAPATPTNPDPDPTFSPGPPTSEPPRSEPPSPGQPSPDPPQWSPPPDFPTPPGDFPSPPPTEEDPDDG